MEAGAQNAVKKIIGGWSKKPDKPGQPVGSDLSFLLESVQQISLGLQEEYDRGAAKMGRDIAVLANQVATLYPIVSRLKSEHAADAKRNRLLEVEQVKLKDVLAKMQSDLEHYRALSAKLREQIEAAAEREAQDKNYVKALKTDLMKLAAQHQDTQGDLAFERRKRAEMEQQRNTLQARLTKLQTEYFQAKREIAKAINDHGEIAGTLEAREHELERLKEDYSAEKSAHAKAEALLGRAQHDLEMLQTESQNKENQLKRLAEQYEAEIERLRLDKTNAENTADALRGKVGLVEKLLASQRAKTDKAYEHVANLQESIRRLMSDEKSGRDIGIQLDDDTIEFAQMGDRIGADIDPQATEEPAAASAEEQQVVRLRPGRKK